MSELISLTCNNCGAPIEAPKSSKFLTCGHCGSRLAIKSSSSAIYTEVLDVIEEIKEQNQDISENLEAIRLQNDLERLDRDWQRDYDRFARRDKRGRQTEPNAIGATITGIVVTVFAVFWMGTATSMGAPAIFPLFGMLFIGFGIFTIIGGNIQAKKYSKAKRHYQRERQNLERKIERR